MNGLNEERIILVSIGNDGELVAATEAPSGPDGETGVQSSVTLEVSKRLTKVGDTSSVVSSTNLGDKSSVSVGREERTKCSPGVDTVGGTLSVSTGAIAVKVLVNVENQQGLVVGSGIFDAQERRVVAVQPIIGVRPHVSWQSDGLGVGPSTSDGCDGSLDGCRPSGVV